MQLISLSSVENLGLLEVCLGVLLSSILLGGAILMLHSLGYSKRLQKDAVKSTLQRINEPTPNIYTIRRKR